MNSRTDIRVSPTFYRFAAGCCAYYVAAQLIQEVTFRLGINDSVIGEAAIHQRLAWLDQFRLILVLLSFSLIPIFAAFAGVGLGRFRVRPAASMLGVAFSLLFVGAEVGVRSIDLFLVSRKWSVEYQLAGTETLKHAIAARIQIWDDSVGAFYFALLVAHLLSSVCFSIATWDNGDKWNRMVALGFILSVVESLGRLLEGYLGQAWLTSLNAVAYFPVVFLNFGTLGVWLWKQALSLDGANGTR